MDEPRAVESSWVRSINWTSGLLTVETKSGSRYSFAGVPESLWRQLQASDSKGRFINAHIKGRFKQL